MTLLTVDPERCDRDGRCIAACPAGIIAFSEKGTLPAMVAGGEDFCIRCGHCVAVCPRDAMTHRVMGPADCPPFHPESLPDPDQAEHFLRARRSIRNYRRQPVPRETLTRLIGIASHAPSGHNRQPVHWRVIYRRPEIERLNGIVIDWMRHLIDQGSPLAEAMHLDRVVAAQAEGKDRICRGAPHLVAAHAPEDERTAPAACTIALTYFDIAAASFGLGTCWAGYFNAAANFWPDMRAALELLPGHTTFGALMVGYPRFTYHRLPRRKPPRVTWK